MDGRDLLSFLGRHLPPWFEIGVVVVAPGRARVHDQGE
jgi:hypothetical protein